MMLFNDFFVPTRYRSPRICLSSSGAESRNTISLNSFSNPIPLPLTEILRYFPYESYSASKLFATTRRQSSLVSGGVPGLENLSSLLKRFETPVAFVRQSLLLPAVVQ